jgi:hypothetical protein
VFFSFLLLSIHVSSKKYANESSQKKRKNKGLKCPRKRTDDRNLCHDEEWKPILMQEYLIVALHAYLSPGLKGLFFYLSIDEGGFGNEV